MKQIRKKTLKKTATLVVFAALSNSFLPLVAQNMNYSQVAALAHKMSSQEVGISEALIETFNILASLPDETDSLVHVRALLENVAKGHTTCPKNMLMEALEHEVLHVLEKHHTKLDDQLLEHIIENLNKAWDSLSTDAPDVTTRRVSLIKFIANLKVLRMAEIRNLFVDEHTTLAGDLKVFGDVSVNGTALFNDVIVNGIPVTGFTDTISIRTLNLLEDPSNGTNALTVQAPALLPANIAIITPSNNGLPGQLLTTNGLNPATLSWTNAGSGGGDVLTTGNTVSATMLLGTLNGFGLNLITNNTARISITSGGTITLNGFSAGLLQTNGSGVVSILNPTNFALQVGNGTTISSLGTGTPGQVMVSGGASANPAFITPTAGTGLTLTTNATTLQYALSTPVSVANGGTGVTSLTTNGVLYGGATVQATAVGAANTVLLGTGAAPSFGQVPNAALANSSITLNNGSNITITGSPVSLGGAATINLVNSPSVSGTLTAGTGITSTTGDLTLSAGNINLTDSTSSSTGNIFKNGTRFLHNAGTQNTFLGKSAGNFALTSANNVGIGQNAGNALTSGNSNALIGAFAGNSLQDGIENTALGNTALLLNVSGNGNTAIGKDALQTTTASNNTALGWNAGTFTATGTNNIFIGSKSGINNDDTEVSNVIVLQARPTAGGTRVSASNQIRIGFGDTANTTCFIDGIRGITTGIANASTVLIDGAGQLGTVNSSRRYKENIRDVGDISKNFMQLRPVSFNYKQHTSADKNYGLIAEEVENTFPELVIYNAEGEVETIKYHLLDALYIKMIQDLQRTVENLQAQLLEQQQEITCLKNK